jgi:hypothetical protein
MNYSGPVPPAPTGASTDAQWQTWWAYQGVLRDLRFEEERLARVIVTDRQHAEKMAAEAACAKATAEAAAAQLVMAAAMRYAADRAREPDPVTPWTDEQLVRQFMFSMADTVPQGTAAMGRAQAYLLALRAVFKPALAAPTAAALASAKDTP